MRASKRSFANSYSSCQYYSGKYAQSTQQRIYKGDLTMCAVSLVYLSVR